MKFVDTAIYDVMNKIKKRNFFLVTSSSKIRTKPKKIRMFCTDFRADFFGEFVHFC